MLRSEVTNIYCEKVTRMTNTVCVKLRVNLIGG